MNKTECRSRGSSAQGSHGKIADAGETSSNNRNNTAGVGHGTLRTGNHQHPLWGSTPQVSRHFMSNQSEDHRTKPSTV